MIMYKKNCGCLISWSVTFTILSAKIRNYIALPSSLCKSIKHARSAEKSDSGCGIN